MEMASQSPGHKAAGERLRALMAERDMRPEELAVRLHVSASTIHRWMAGVVSPTPHLGRLLAEVFEVDRREFYAKEAA
jgi:transcriptional regulator with XRE-family HTH domain